MAYCYCGNKIPDGVTVCEDPEDHKPSDASAGCDALTEREKWLMIRAYSAGTIAGACNSPRTFENWLDGGVADGVTVEMVLAKEAP